jgi:hypothetical protein
MVYSKRLTDILEQIKGLPCWQVSKGHGSVLFLNFGDPTKRIREPVKSHSSHDTVSKALGRRKVFIEGEWQLRIDMCCWTIFDEDKTLAQSESAEESIFIGCRHLDGQILQEIEVDHEQGTTTFMFDLGARLYTYRCSYELSDQQWSIYHHTLHQATFHNDGTVDYE